MPGESGYGFAGHIGFAKESSGGTPVAATDYMTALSESLHVEISRYETVNIHGSFAEPDDSDGVKMVEGELVATPDPHNLGFFLLGAMGTKVTSEVASGSGLFTHSFSTRLDSDWDRRYAEQPFTFEVYRQVGSAQQYSGVCISMLEFNISGNNGLQMTCELVGTHDTNIAPTDPTYPATGNHFAFDTCSISIAGAEMADIEALTITIDNQLEGIPALANTGKRNDKVKRAGPQTVIIAGDIAFEGITEYEAFRNQTERAMKVSFTDSSSFQLVFDIPRMVYTAFPTEMGGRDRIVVGFEGKARFHTGSGVNMQVRLTNVTSSY